MAIQYVDTLRNSMLDLIDADVNGGGGAGKVIVISGALPADPDTALTAGNATLAVVTCSTTAFTTAALGVMTANAFTSDTDATAGVATGFRFLDFSNATVLQGVMTTSGGDITVNRVTVQSGDTVSIGSFIITEGNS